MPREIIILSTSESDLGACLASFWGGKSSVILLTPEAYVKKVEIVREGQSTMLYPRLPVIPCSLTSSSDIHASGLTDTENFLLSERLSCILSALALNSLPVVNRPSRKSPIGLLTDLSVVSSQHNNEALAPCLSSEVHLAGSLEDLPESHRYWALDLERGQLGWARDMQVKNGLYRCRLGYSDPSYEQVLVAAHQAWRTSNSLLRSEIVSRSCAVAQELDLQLCLVTWRFMGSAADFPEIIFIDPWPAPKTIEKHLCAVSLALEKFLL